MKNNHHSENNPDNQSERVGDMVSIFLAGAVWHANFQLDGKQRRPSLKTRSKKEARRLAILLEADLLSGRYAGLAKAPAVATVVTAYMAYIRTEGRAAKTISKCDLTFRRLEKLCGEWKVRTIADVNLALVDAYRAMRVEAGAKPKTVHNETVIVRQLVNFARRRDMVQKDPLKGMKLRNPKPTRQPCWTREECDRILAACDVQRRPPLALLAETGMRIGELKHLTWQDIDFDHGVLHVREKEGWKPKTGDQRIIPVSPAARAVLEGLGRRSRWVFTAPRSGKYPAGDHQLSERRLLQYLKRVLKRLGLPGHLHTFRHTFISHALMQGTPEAIVRQWVGHVDREVLKLYTHINDAASQAAMQRLAVDPNPLQQGKEATNGQAQSESDPARFQHDQAPPDATTGAT